MQTDLRRHFPARPGLSSSARNPYPFPFFGGLLAAVLAFVSPLQGQPLSAAFNTSVPGMDPGEMLLAELNCIACHQADFAVVNRLAPRQSPRIGRDGLMITPQYLRAFLTDPHREKPGATMPNLLHGMPPLEQTQTVEALVHYLISTYPEPSPPRGADPFKLNQGKALFHQIGCVACHDPQEPASTASASPFEETQPPSAHAPLALTNSIPLGNLAKKTSVDEMARFLLNPLKIRPSGRMPGFKLTSAEAEALAMYLLRDQAPGMSDPSVPLQKTAGLRYEYFEEDFTGPDVNAPDFESFTPKSTGYIDRFTMEPHLGQANVGLRFTGFVTVPADGVYTFYTVSDDGSRLYIGRDLVVQNDGFHAMTERSGAIGLKAGEHPIQVTWFNGSGDAGLEVLYEGPGVEKQEIPASALSYLGQPMIPLEREEFTLDLEKAARGKKQFASLGCAACHQSEDQPAPFRGGAKPLNELGHRKFEGCLETPLKAGLPDYQLTSTQREHIRAILADRQKLSTPLDPDQRIRRTLTALNCIACHSRDGYGGPDPARLPYFTTTEKADMGDEGRIPPHLTGVGDKLRPEWLRKVLLEGAQARPYMATRMPLFGEHNLVRLLEALENADADRPPVETESVFSLRDLKLGRKLVGTDGLSCVSCHDFRNYPSLGIRAMDLAQTAQRLKKEWFMRYLINPAALRPGTRMPSFWPEGKAVNQEICDGDTAQQLETIWLFLSQGPDADVPRGLIQGKMELVATDEPVIYRHFIEGAGARAIGVGYPEKANLAFDANQLRLALIWQGAFIDAAPHRTGRGIGFQPPLGRNVVPMPPGPSFAILSDTNSPWPTLTGKEGSFQMRGYELDPQRRPIFRYSFHSIQIEDHPIPVPGELDPEFTRVLTLKSEQPVVKVRLGGTDQAANAYINPRRREAIVGQLWFRAAVGNKIEPLPDGRHRIDGKLLMQFQLPPSAKPLLRRKNNQWELLVPVIFEENDARIVQKIIW